MVTTHLSIGEVLGLLQDEFPDVTISKIRFLESQGLIDPERTPSGYRKFYEADIERLRWILTQQREHFLPLKVIKDRLADDAEAPLDEVQAPEAADIEQPAPAGEPIWMADLARAQASAPDEAPARPPLRLDRGPTEVSLTAAELSAAAGLSLEAVRELEQFGLIAGRPLGEDSYFDGDALLIATKAAGFMAHGVGARHLRMFKVSADREAGFLEQVAMPMLKQRNPEARRQAVETVEELSALGHDLRAALLRSQLRHHLDQG